MVFTGTYKANIKKECDKSVIELPTEYRGNITPNLWQLLKEDRVICFPQYSYDNKMIDWLKLPDDERTAILGNLERVKVEDFQKMPLHSRFNPNLEDILIVGSGYCFEIRLTEEKSSDGS